jgi:tRNA 2-thiocytidine biosynthesis protein TtcA
MSKSKKGLLSKRVTRAIMEYELINKNDRVLIALSGGKDSLLLCWLLSRMSRSFPIPFTVHALHVSSEVHPPPLAPALTSLMEEWGIPYTILTRELKSHLRHGQDFNCFLCARKRREALLTFAQENQYETIALGHHMDDLLQTLLMNMTWQGELAAMPPRLDYTVKLKMIRPLCLIQEHHIKDFVCEMEWKIPAKHCPYEGQTRRKEAAALVEMMSQGKDSLKYNIYTSLGNIKTDLLPGSII